VRGEARWTGGTDQVTPDDHDGDMTRMSNSRIWPSPSLVGCISSGHADTNIDNSISARTSIRRELLTKDELEQHAGSLHIPAQIAG
jgi:hypothetical protein